MGPKRSKKTQGESLAPSAPTGVHISNYFAPLAEHVDQRDGSLTPKMAPAAAIAGGARRKHQPDPISQQAQQPCSLSPPQHVTGDRATETLSPAALTQSAPSALGDCGLTQQRACFPLPHHCKLTAQPHFTGTQSAELELSPCQPPLPQDLLNPTMHTGAFNEVSSAGGHHQAASLPIIVTSPHSLQLERNPLIGPSQHGQDILLRENPQTVASVPIVADLLLPAEPAQVSTPLLEAPILSSSATPLRGLTPSSARPAHETPHNLSENWAQEHQQGYSSQCASPLHVPGSQVSLPAHQDWASSPGSATWGVSPPRTATISGTPPRVDNPSAADPSASNHLLPPEVALLALQGHPELRALLSLLPSKHDMQTLACDLKSAWQHDLQAVQSEVDTIHARVQKLEENQSSMQQLLTTVQRSTSTRESLHQSLISQLDDLENRNRRNNIRLKGVPESIHATALIPTLTKFFNTILNKEPDTSIEFDRAHRALRPQSTDPARPRDVVCRIHLYSLKEEIMRKSRLSADLNIAGSKVSLFPDLSRRTLRLRAATKPLLSLLQDRRIPYRWGFPFALQVRHQDKSATFKSPADLPLFLNALDLPEVTLPEWDDAFFNVFPSTGGTDAATSKRHPLALTPRQQRTRRRLGSTSPKDSNT